jgi:hypothetical protein
MEPFWMVSLYIKQSEISGLEALPDKVHKSKERSCTSLFSQFIQRYFKCRGGSMPWREHVVEGACRGGRVLTDSGSRIVAR